MAKLQLDQPQGTAKPAKLVLDLRLVPGWEVEKARGHKYLRKYRGKGRNWIYVYKEGGKEVHREAPGVDKGHKSADNGGTRKTGGGHESKSGNRNTKAQIHRLPIPTNKPSGNADRGGRGHSEKTGASSHRREHGSLAWSPWARRERSPGRGDLPSGHRPFRSWRTDEGKESVNLLSGLDNHPDDIQEAVEHCFAFLPPSSQEYLRRYGLNFMPITRADARQHLKILQGRSQKGEVLSDQEGMQIDLLTGASSQRFGQKVGFADHANRAIAINVEVPPGQSLIRHEASHLTLTDAIYMSKDETWEDSTLAQQGPKLAESQKTARIQEASAWVAKRQREAHYLRNDMEALAPSAISGLRNFLLLKAKANGGAELSGWAYHFAYEHAKLEKISEGIEEPHSLALSEREPARGDELVIRNGAVAYSVLENLYQQENHKDEAERDGALRDLYARARDVVFQEYVAVRCEVDKDLCEDLAALSLPPEAKKALAYTLDLSKLHPPEPKPLNILQLGAM